MLPSSKRLTTSLFKETIAKGRIFHSSLFTIRVMKSEGLSRFSVAVPKKVAKTAVERNKLRRRTYSVLRNLHSRIKVGFHGVFITKPSIKTANIDSIREDTEQFFVKSGLLK